MPTKTAKFQCTHDSKLMQNYRLGQSFDRNSEMHLEFDINQNPNIYLCDNKHPVGVIEQDQNSTTGWKNTYLGFFATKISIINIPEKNILYIYGIDKGKLFGAWKEGEVFKTKTYIHGVEEVQACYDEKNDSVMLFATMGDVIRVAKHKNPAASIAESDWVVHMNPDQIAFKINARANADAGYDVSALSGIGTGNHLTLCMLQNDEQKKFEMKAMDTLSRSLDLLDRCELVRDSEKKLNIITISDSKLYIAKQDKGEWDYSFSAWKCIDEKTKLADFQIINNPKGHLEIMAIGSDGKLYHSKQQADLTWQPFFKLGDAITRMKAIIDSHGRRHIIFFAPNKKMNYLRQNPETSEWTLATFSLDMTKIIEVYKSHTTYFKIEDSDGVPQINKNVTVMSDVQQTIVINQKSYLLSPDKNASVKTDMHGVIHIERETNELHALPLKLHIEGMDANNEIQLFADAEIQNKLGSLSKEQLLDAKDSKGHSIIKGDFRKGNIPKDVTHALHKCVGLMKKRQSAVLNPDVQFNPDQEQGSAILVQKRPGATAGMIDLDAVDEQYWSMEFGEQTFSCSDISPTEAQDAFETIPKTLSRLEDVMQLQETLSWGDIWHAIENEVIKIEKIFVKFEKKLEKKIHMIIKVVINGIHAFVHNVVEMVEQVWHGIKVLFKKIEAAFELLFEWLGLLFHWENVIETEKVLSHLTRKLIDKLIDSKDTAEELVDKEFDNIAQIISTFFKNEKKPFENDLTLNQLIHQSSKKNITDQNYKKNYHKHAAKCNVIHSKLSGMKSLSSYLDVANGSEGSALEKGLGDLAQTIRKTLSQEKLEEKFGEIKKYFKSAKTIKNFGDAAIITFYDLIDELVSLILEIAKDLIKGIIKIVRTELVDFRTLVEKSLDIPLLTQLFKLISKESELTLLRLGTFLMSVVGTFVYEAVHDAAPFKKDDVKNFFLNNDMPWGMDNDTKEIGDAKEVALNIFNSMSGIIYTLVYTMGDIGSDIYASEASTPDEDDLEIVSIYSIFPAILMQIGAAFSAFKTKSTADKLNLSIWIVSWIPIGLDCACFKETRKITKFQDMIENCGPYINTVLGLILLILGAIACHEMKDDKNYNGCSRAEVVLMPIPLFVEFLIALEKKSGNGLSLMFLLLIDLIGDAGAGICRAASPYVSEEKLVEQLT